MTTTTRRNIIVGAATLPLLPVSAYATPAESDPVVVAFAEWRALDAECERLHDVYAELEERFGPVAKEAEAYRDEFFDPACDRRRAIEMRISETVATTPAGLAGQVRIAMVHFGYDNGFGMEQLEGRLLHSMLAGAEGMANA